MLLRGSKWLTGLAFLAAALAVLPAAAQTAGAPRKDASAPGAERKDTQVLHPKNGETISVRLPLQGQLFINSLIPWAVTGGKESPELVIKYDVRGVAIQHIGAHDTDGAKASFTLRLVDGRTITVNVRLARGAKYKIGYAVIT
jgi:hypothetical protein